MRQCSKVSLFSSSIEIEASGRKMKRSIGLILVWHFLSAIDFSYSKIVNCSYINGKTDSVELSCKSDFSLRGFYNRAYDIDSDEEDYAPFHEDTSIRNGECYSDLFNSESKEENRLNVKLLKVSAHCGQSKSLSDQFPNIRELDISSNSNLDRLQSFKNLDKVNASHNRMKSLSLFNFNSLPSLYEVDYSYNGIELIYGKIDENALIAIVNISHNELESFQEDDFGTMTKLKVLDLSYNKIAYIQLNLFQSNTNLEVLRLDNNPMKVFDCHFLSPMKNLASVTMTLDKIEQIDLNCKGCTIGLVPDNINETIIRLAGVKNVLRFNNDYFKKLAYFMMAESETENISQIIELLPSSLQLLGIGSSKLNEQNVNIIERFNKLEQLILMHSNMTDLEPNIFSHQSESLKLLDLSNNHLRINNPTAIFAPLKNLHTFVISNAHLENIHEVLQAITPSVIHLDVSFNYVGKLDVTTFQRFTNLQFLNLSHTNLSNFGFNTFYHQTKLRSLDLSYNQLKKVDFTLFVRSFLDLTHLYLEGNNLSEIKTITAVVFPKLSTLAVSKNQLSCHDLAAFLHQWKDLKVIGNPTNQTNINGIDCDPNAAEETTKKMEKVNGVHILTPSKQEIIVTHTESHITKYSVLFLCVICCGYLVVKSKLIPRIREKLAKNPLATNGRCQPATSTLVLMEQENL
ncbi:protein artichoke-like [Sitodiplosis mosellana]|uniref:protein artichoke-like n=1 Tax=Sitodiplosis mosellana TaxID=263140 RepID=UPI0024452B64|nr:protein artichoke-like [Sitodiplosis mosellana]